MSLSIEMQCWKQVDPIGIAPSNQIELPTPFPCLDRLLASNRLLDRIIGLDEHETSQAVPLAEIGSGNRAMLVNASGDVGGDRSEEHTSELPSLMRISYAVFCLKTKRTKTHTSI